MSRKLREALRNVKRFCQGQTTSLVGRDYGDGVSTGSDSDRVALCYWIHRSLSLPVLTPSLNSKKSHVNILLS